jgi:acyl-CoA thioester hydrolase
VGRSIAMPPELQAKVQAIRAAHAGLPKPAQAGQPIGIRRKSP